GWRSTLVRCRGVSRSPARWPARQRIARKGGGGFNVSVDHRRAGLRANIRRVSRNFEYIVSVDHRRAGLRADGMSFGFITRKQCQSITGALACAPQIAPKIVPLLNVSVDHRRAGLRAA